MIDRGWKEIKRDCSDLHRQAVKVGFRAGGPSHNDVPVLHYATWNEFGTADGHVPSRPFMRRTADLAVRDVRNSNSLMVVVVRRMLRGNMSANQILDALGMWFQAQIRATIRNSRSWAKPNAPATIAIKGSSTPLIDDAIMIGTVDYQKTRL